MNLNADDLTELSYKELQAKAKQLSIAANQKKEVLVNEIIAKAQGNDENVDCNIIVEPVREKVCATPLATRSVRTTRSTAKKALLATPAPVEDVEVEESTMPTIEEKVVEAVTEKAPVSKIVEESKMEVSSTPIPESPLNPTASEEEEEADEEVEYPNPTILFDGQEEETQVDTRKEKKAPKIAVNRHVYFGSPDGKGPVVGHDAEIGAKHMHFASPDLQMGKEVHWSYDDYNSNTNEETTAEEEAVIEESEEVVETTTTSTKADKAKLSPGHSDRVMTFWLTKAFANASFFK